MLVLLLVLLPVVVVVVAAAAASATGAHCATSGRLPMEWMAVRTRVREATDLLAQEVDTELATLVKTQWLSEDAGALCCVVWCVFALVAGGRAVGCACPGWDMPTDGSSADGGGWW